MSEKDLICGECGYWLNGKCLITGTIGVEPEEMEFHALACESFEPNE